MAKRTLTSRDVIEELFEDEYNDEWKAVTMNLTQTMMMMRWK